MRTRKSGFSSTLGQSSACNQMWGVAVMGSDFYDEPNGVKAEFILAESRQ